MAEAQSLVKTVTDNLERMESGNLNKLVKTYQTLLPVAPLNTS